MSMKIKISFNTVSIILYSFEDGILSVELLALHLTIINPLVG